ncbi:MAG TPA: 30S ribosomal protein S8 [Myxococcota bacterium]|nr:30S ribosomal protein S8 [Myxococcota bacterium]HQK49976.1 30S ribosomal protein S8 [Myxococcota bacterium]
MTTDPIGDMLTRIRNALQAGHADLEIPSSNLKKRIAEILKEQGFIEDFSVLEDRTQGILKIYLKYVAPKRGAIAGIRRESKPGRRVYVGKNDIPRVRRGMGLAILSTPQGVMADQEARKRGIGGELLLTVW